MKDFIGVKHVKAKPMTRGEYDSLWAIPLGSPITPKTAQTPQDPNLEGYLVEYQDGGKPNHKDFDNYISWSPKEVFEKAYFHTPLYPDHAMQIMRTAVNAQGDISTPPLTFDFSAALSQLKTGACVSRHAWRQGERNKWLSMSNPESIELPAERFWSEHNQKYAEIIGGKAYVLPSITEKTHGGCIQMGWTPSQEDMFANDWYVANIVKVTRDTCTVAELDVQLPPKLDHELLQPTKQKATTIDELVGKFGQYGIALNVKWNNSEIADFSLVAIDPNDYTLARAMQHATKHIYTHPTTGLRGIIGFNKITPAALDYLFVDMEKSILAARSGQELFQAKELPFDFDKLNQILQELFKHGIAVQLHMQDSEVNGVFIDLNYQNADKVLSKFSKLWLDRGAVLSPVTDRPGYQLMGLRGGSELTPQNVYALLKNVLHDLEKMDN